MPDPAPALPLRDIHLPAPIGLWPPAPGWWVIALLLPSLIWLLWRWRRRRALDPRRAVLQQLIELEKNPRLSPSDRVKAISILLRRAAMTIYGRPEAASLSGEAWLEFLDRILEDQAFSTGAGRILLDAPFRPDFDGEVAPLFELCRRWLKHLPQRQL